MGHHTLNTVFQTTQAIWRVKLLLSFVGGIFCGIMKLIILQIILIYLRMVMNGNWWSVPTETHDSLMTNQTLQSPPSGKYEN